MGLVEWPGRELNAMTRYAELSIATLRTPAIAAWARTLLARLRTGRSRRLGRLDPERWSRHLLRDVGLAE